MKEAMKLSSLSLTKLAGLTGFEISTLSRKINGQVGWSIEDVNKLLPIFRIKLIKYIFLE